MVRKTQDVSIWDEMSNYSANVIVDGEGIYRLAVDSLVKDYDHEYLEQGRIFNVNTYASTLGSAQQLTIVMTTGTTYVHLTWSFYVALEATFRFIEGATRTGGTLYTPWNRNRNSTNTPLATAWTGSTYTGGSIILEQWFGSSGGVKSAGGGQSTDEWVLKPNTTYVITVISNKPGNLANLDINWYEEVD